MKSTPYFEVNAFTNGTFSGNPAGVCLLEKWCTDRTLQEIAAQNNLPETAFVVGSGEQHTIRWFTPLAEVDLCGHATLAAAHILASHSTARKNQYTFRYGGGVLFASATGDGCKITLPTRPGLPFAAIENVRQLLGVEATEATLARDLVLVLSSEKEVRAFQPDHHKLAMLPGLGVVITALGDTTDFVSRCFFPKIGIPEDPVTGSAHCTLAPLWAGKLGKRKLSALQASSRGGHLWCEVSDESVILSGKAETYLEGVIHAAAV